MPPKIGDVIEIAIDDRYAYAHYSHKHKTYGALLRVMLMDFCFCTAVSVPVVTAVRLVWARVATHSQSASAIAANRFSLVLFIFVLSVHFDFAPSRIGVVSTSLSDFTMVCVPTLYFLKCGVSRCDL